MANPVIYPYPVRYLKLSTGKTIAYIDEGTGDKVLFFIHGLATYSMCWEKNINELQKVYRCIAIDLPGNGLSEHDNFPYSMNFFAGVVYEVILKLQLKDVALVGHSMGAQIALTTVLNAPACANALVLCAPAGFEQFSSFEKSVSQTSLQIFDFFSNEENNLKESIKNSFYKNSSQANGMIEDLVKLIRHQPANVYKHMMKACIDGMLHEPVYNSLHLIKIRTLVLFGENDALIPNKLMHPVTTRHIAEEGTKQLPHAVLKMIPQCGHFLQWEKAAEVNALIKTFIK